MSANTVKVVRTMSVPLAGALPADWVGADEQAVRASAASAVAVANRSIEILLGMPKRYTFLGKPKNGTQLLPGGRCHPPVALMGE
jgi:hypothetical protein